MQFPNLKESHFLESLWWGLDFLASENKKIEDRVRERLQIGHGGEVVGLVFSQFRGSPEHTMALNYFVWYANSLVPFLMLFSKAYSPSEDWKSAFSCVLKWRNKVSAHPAFAAPRDDDNIYSQDESIMMTPDWEDDCFVIGRWIVSGPSGYSHPDWAWSLAKTHRDLVAYVGRNKK